MKFEINLNYSLEKIYTAFFDKKSFIEAINASSIGFDIDSKDEFLLDSNFKNKESFSLFVWSKSEEEYDSVIDLIFIHESQDKFEFLITDFGVYFDEGDIADSSMFKKNIDKYLIKIKLIPLSENLTKVVVRDVLLINSRFIKMIYYFYNIRHYFLIKRKTIDTLSFLLENNLTK